jgi:CDP-diacylglycerol---serine O-phosphatidyltransferase
MKRIPNFITSLNLAAGFLSIIATSNGDTVEASWLILAALIFDFLDGFSARLLKAYSETGKELDSLADVVSFGVAPAFIIYKLLVPLVRDLVPPVSGAPAAFGTVILFIPVLMPVCAALRLAKFNLDATQAKSFKGLPTPANATAIISVVIASQFSSAHLLNSFIKSPGALLVYTVILSLLMVTCLPLLSLKFENLKLKGNEGRYMFIGLVLLSFIVFGMAAFLLIIPFYIIASFIERLI